MRYTKEDLGTDLEWFDGFGVDSATAEEYIRHLLGCTPEELEWEG